MFLVELNYCKPLEYIDQIREEHLQFLRKYYDRGIFLMSGAKIPRDGGCILAGNITREELEEILKEDSFYRHQVANYRIFEFQASMRTTNFDSFFND